MATERDDKRRVAGILLIVLGVVMLAGRLDDRFDWQIGGLWPVFIIALGLVRFWTTRSDCRSGVGIIVAGVVLLLHTQDIVRLRDSWPLFIVGGGLSILVRAWGPGRRQLPGEKR